MLTSRRWQFTVGTLLALMVWIAVWLASYRAFGPGQRGLAMAVLAAHLLLVGFIMWRFMGRAVACDGGPAAD